MQDTEFFLNRYKQTAQLVGQAAGGLEDYIAPSFPVNDEMRVEIARFIAQGGKRFRPALSLIIASAFGHDTVLPHLALETFHKYLLAHDDIIDRDNMRYGAPTVHAKLAERCLKPDEQTHFGNSLGIIAGDLMEAATHKIILQSALPAESKILLEQLIVQAVEEVAWGWYDQFLMDYMPLDSPELSFERIEKSIIWVTGKYSLKLPLLFGFAAAGITAPAGLEAFADTAGALFQTGDDLIGLFGNTKDTGKSNVGDITQGKKTLPMWLSYQQAAPADKALLVTLVGNKSITEAEAQSVRNIIKRSGGLEKCKALMADYRDRCLQQLAVIDLPADVRRFLNGFVWYLETRDR